MLLVLCASTAVSLGQLVAPNRPDPSTWQRTLCGPHSGNGTDLITVWGREISPGATPLPEYPRPQMVRTALAPSAQLRDSGDAATWQTLNGLWEWEPVQISQKCCSPMPVPEIPAPPFGKTLSKSILVPFPMESCLSAL